MTLSEA